MKNVGEKIDEEGCVGKKKETKMEAEVGGPEGDGNVREGAGLYASGGGWTVWMWT